MSKLFMLAGGVVEAAEGHVGAVCAYIVASSGRASRIFRVRGPIGTPEVTELPSATTVDIGRFETELGEELAPTLDAIRARGGKPAVARPTDESVFDVVRKHLASTEGAAP